MDPYNINNNSCATLDGFIETVQKLLTAAWGQGTFILSEEEPTGTDPQSLPIPHITMDLSDRKHMSEQSLNGIPGFKSSFRGKFHEQRNDPEYPGHFIHEFRKYFHCEVTFKIWHKTNSGARSIAEKLEYFMEAYAGLFKEHGMFQIKFNREGSPKVIDSSRQFIPKRELVYDIYIVRTDIVRTKQLYDVQISMNISKEANTDNVKEKITINF